MPRIPLVPAASATLLLALAAEPALADPLPVNLVASLPTAPARIRRFLVSDTPVLDVEALAPAFALAGTTEYLGDPAGPFTHHADGADHAFVFQRGGAVFHATSILGSETKITKRTNSQVWNSAVGLLNTLGINGYGDVYTASRGSIGKAEVTVHNPDGTTTGPDITHQVATYVLKLNNRTTFGAGGEIQVVYGRNGRLAAFQHGLRNLADGGLQTCDTPSVALDRFLDRADLDNRYNVLKNGLAAVDHADLTAVTLGYYMPDATTWTDTLEPVYEIKGTLFGTDDLGNPQSVDLLWYEPAIADGAIPSLGIYADPTMEPIEEPLPGELKPVD